MEKIDGNNASGIKRSHDQVDEEEGESYSIAEIIQTLDQEDQTAVAVLGASDGQNCSYDKGYVKRQALYSCLTCNPDRDSPPAGICLACSLKCHPEHDLVELYTKRNFRCDCGNSKLPCRCKLRPDKEYVNEGNSYNQNFKGLYCICHRPYPDPDEGEEAEKLNQSEMIQCVICEDWLHHTHSNNSLDLDVVNVDEAEFICQACTLKCDFLSHYKHLLLTSGEVLTIEKCDTVSEVDVTSSQEESSSQNSNIGENSDSHVPLSSKNENLVQLGDENSFKIDKIDSESTQDSGLGSSPPSENGEMKVIPTENVDIARECPCKNKSEKLEGGTWWREGWRNHLCKCTVCMGKYGELGVMFLCDPEDPLDVYEAKGRENKDVTKNLTENFIGQKLEKLDHFQKAEVMLGFNEMVEGFSDALKNITESGRSVITSDDINKLFENLRAKKRARLENGHY